MPGADRPLSGWECGMMNRNGDVVEGYSFEGSKGNRMVGSSRRGRGTLDPWLPLQEPVCLLVSPVQDTIVSGGC